MSSKSEKADAIKELAVNGRFREIEEKFGKKAAIKGREYVRKQFTMNIGTILYESLTLFDYGPGCFKTTSI